MAKKRGSVKMLWIIAVLFIGLSAFFYWQNNGIMVTEIKHSNPKIPEAFDNYKILQISDLHNKSFGDNQRRLLQKMEKNSPDIIVITGDLVDRRRYNLNTAMELIKGAVNIADVYYVSGNHEAWSGKYEEIKKTLQDHGVTVLDDQKSPIIRGNDTIEFIGLSDPDFHKTGYGEENPHIKFQSILEDLSEESVFQILLSHRPELFELYREAKVDLIFSGHAHGGQFRLPLIGGFMAPGQGFFPEYTSGVNTIDESTLVVSRGLGNSIIPLRIGNRPEVVVLTLKAN